ncbi:dihydrolipoyl dehydrogenase [Candidatus Fermentibacteria bacterium]|nr:MAG: dihydrolipoyl dehydrogenase [Candidatus Fermentibacteria bacterium]
MEKQLDVVIIGSGTAGLSALGQVRKRTDNFLLINDGPYGTTCARVGCMPSKALIEAAELYHGRTLYEEMGFYLNGSVAVDGKAVLKRVRRLRDNFVKGVKRSTDNLDENHNIPGRATIKSPNLVEVNGQLFKTKKLIIATGSRTVVPGPWKELGDLLLTSDSIFEMEDLPESLAVAGLGAIGLELAQSFARLGVRVTGFDALHTVGGLTDPEVGKAAAEIIGREFPVHLGASVKLKKTLNNKVKVSWEGNSITVNKVLAAVGRRPNIDGLGLENLGVELDKRGLPPVNQHTLQIGDLPVFMPGDVNGRAPILHEAADDGHIAGFNAMLDSDKKHCFCRRTPIGIVFTHPNIAFAGSRFRDLHMDDALTAEEDFTKQARAKTAARNQGLLKMYASGVTGKLLGAEMIIPSGEHIAHMLSWAIQRGLTVFEMLELPFYHPVIEEGVRGALRKLASQVEKRESGPEVPLCRELPNGCLE